MVPFATQPDLAATMDIQIPALAWQPTAAGRFQRMYYLDGQAVPVEVAEAPGALHFFYDPPDPTTAARLETVLRQTFPEMIGDLALDRNPILRALRARYRGVIVMHADPFEALVLTILSQNRTGEIVRKVYPALAACCGGITPRNVAALDLAELTERIRSAGPYKAPRLAATAVKVLTDGEESFHKSVVDAPNGLAYLESFPGVAHKTAACVLVFSARSTTTLPVDTHLFRVVDRLGLARHDGVLTKATREALIAALLAYGPALAPAHFLFLLVGRATCLAAAPRCTACFLQPHCRFAAARFGPITSEEQA